jgi:adenine-specific DNA-methyltransferase
MSRLTELIAQVEKKDPALADELRKEVDVYAKRRPFGLNFERHLPECVRLYNRPVRRGDKVNVLPKRGKMETASNKVKWLVKSIETIDCKREASLVSIDTESGETLSIPVDNLVPIAEFNEPIYPGLKETGRIERGGDKPFQTVINGENYHALETLLYAYEGKVDCIYIDPPYNTGAKDWKYNNDYVDSEDAYRHSKWLAFIERRLKLAKRLLNPENSVLIVTIDEKEYLRLGLLLEQLFMQARIQMISITNNLAGVQRKNEFGRVDEYAYLVMFGTSTPLRMPLSSEWIAAGGRTHLGEIRWDLLRRTGTNAQRSNSPGCFYPIYISTDGEQFCGVGKALSLSEDIEAAEIPGDVVAVWPLRQDGSEGRWQLSPESFLERQAKGLLRIGKLSGKNTAIYYLKPAEEEKVRDGTYEVTGTRSDGSLITNSSENVERMSLPTTQWKISAHDSTHYGTRLIKRIIPGRSFPFPKSLYAVEDTIRFFIANNPNSIVLDFFSGSGTTAHAVMRLNHQDGGHRRCICVTNNEVSVEETAKLVKQGLRPGDSEWERHGICEYITKPRITAAITGKTPEGVPIKGDYKFTDEFPMSDGFEENAVFYDLTYQDEISVKLDQAFEEIAPILWMRAGSVGRCISKRLSTFDVSETYGVLFDYKYVGEFMAEIENRDSILIVYIVTDQDSRYQDVAGRLPDGIEPIRLYESYIRSFRINQGE